MSKRKDKEAAEAAADRAEALGHLERALADMPPVPATLDRGQLVRAAASHRADR